LVFIVATIVGKRLFPADPASGGGFKGEKEMPLWLGRLLFAVVGVVSVIVGLSFMLSN